MVIKSKKELREVLNYEYKRRKRAQIKNSIGWFLSDLIFFLHPGNSMMFTYCLRMEEYYMNKGGGLCKIMSKFLHAKHYLLQYWTGIELYPGCADIGVRVNHCKCVISKAARIGRDSVILSDVTIGGTGGLRDDGAATIGERVFISSGARIIGNIKIADNVVIGANSVVVKDILEPGITVAGVPARKISNQGSELYIPETN